MTTTKAELDAIRARRAFGIFDGYHKEDADTLLRLLDEYRAANATKKCRRCSDSGELPRWDFSGLTYEPCPDCAALRAIEERLR